MLVQSPEMTSFFLPAVLTALQFLLSSKASKLGTFRAMTSRPGNRPAISGKNSPLDFGSMDDRTTGIPRMPAALAAPIAAPLMMVLSPDATLLIIVG